MSGVGAGLTALPDLMPAFHTKSKDARKRCEGVRGGDATTERSTLIGVAGWETPRAILFHLRWRLAERHARIIFLCDTLRCAAKTLSRPRQGSPTENPTTRDRKPRGSPMNPHRLPWSAGCFTAQVFHRPGTISRCRERGAARTQCEFVHYRLCCFSREKPPIN